MDVKDRFQIIKYNHFKKFMYTVNNTVYNHKTVKIILYYYLLI